MNVIFHTAAALGISVVLIDANHTRQNANIREDLVIGLFAFIIGIISHGVLDYIPHCYPLAPKVDVILSLAIICIIIYLTKRKYKPIIGLAFIGSIFPDLVDLAPTILNRYLGISLPISQDIFPWHWKMYSGSIYHNDCDVSTLNHILLIVSIAIVCWVKRQDVKRMFTKKE